MKSDFEKISYAKTDYDQEEINAVVKCLKESTQRGKYSLELEREIAHLFNKRYSLYVNSGSSALYLGIESLDLPPQSEVITPSLTFSTTVGCLVKNDLVPAFVDVEPLSYCIDCNQIEALITEKTRAILAPNLLGNLCNWPVIRKIADKYNLIVIEDSADTIGSSINDIPTGKFTDLSITSFYGSHIINCAGNGGALALNNENVMSKAKLLRSWGRSSSLFDEESESIENRFNIKLEDIEYDAKFVFQEIGYNLEGSEIGAAFGLIQLKKLKQNILKRQDNFSKQKSFFLRYKDFFEIPKELPNCSTAWLAFPILIKDNAPFSRREFQIFLEERNIQTRVVFTGNILKQPMTKKIKKIISKNGYENSDRIMKNGVLLPLHNAMQDYMFDRLHKTIEEFISNF